MPLPSPSRVWRRTRSAASAALSTRSGARNPLLRLKKPGSSSVPQATTGTPRVSSTSRVRGTSRIDLGPAHTTATGVRASSSRSAEMSIDSCPPRWTPPMPPVAKTPMPASCAAIMVADTVVPAQPGRPSTPARFCRETLGTPLSLRQLLELRRREANEDASVVERHGGRHGPAGADRLFRAARGGQVVGIRQPVGDERRFEHHHGAAVGQGGGDLGGRLEQVGVHQRKPSAAGRAGRVRAIRCRAGAAAGASRRRRHGARRARRGATSRPSAAPIRAAAG